jgi:hypothetical protein
LALRAVRAQAPLALRVRRPANFACATRRLVLEHKGNKSRGPMTSPRAATCIADRTHARRSLRNSAAWKLAAARAAASTGSGEIILNEISDNEIEIAAALRRLSRKPPAFRPRVGKGSRRAGFDTFRKRSQVPRTNPTGKNSTKTKLQDERRPHWGGTAPGTQP